MLEKGVVRAVWSLVILISSLAWAQSPGNYNFNLDWRLHVGDVENGQALSTDVSDWQTVSLPHAWNEDDAFKLDIRELRTGIAWYRKTFTLDDAAVAGKVFLEFQGVRHAAEVWVNGQQAVLSENGVMAFGADISKLVKPGENVVAVRTDNSWGYRERATNTPFQWNDRNFYANYGGINKNVILHLKPSLYQTLPLYSNLGTTGIYVYAQEFDIAGKSATVVVESQVRNERDAAQSVVLDVTVKDFNGNPAGHFVSDATEIQPGATVTLKASARLSGLNFWSWGYGYLYDVTTALKVGDQMLDPVVTRTGFRKTEFANGVLTLNDRVIQVKGYAQRTTNEWPALGIDVPPWVSDFSNGMMVTTNANLVRWMHVTPSKQDVESCDRVGLMQAVPAGDSEGDPSGRRWDLRVLLMRDAIIYNRNNPSVIFWEAGNKGIREEHMQEMLQTKNQWDPHGGRAMGSREMLSSTIAEWGGEMLYINKSARKPMWATEYLRDENLRRYMDELTPPFHKDGEGKEGQSGSYNRNQDSMARVSVRAWYDYWRERPGTGKRVSGGGVNIIFSDSNTHHRGVENYRRSGETDAMRLPKEAFYAHQVMWDGWVDPKPAIHIIGHWNYAPGTVKDEFVVSSAEKVELFVNDKSVGYGEQSARFWYTFPQVKFESGTVRAVGYDAHGKAVCSAVVRTVGDPVALKLTAHVDPSGFRADGSDLALVDVQVVDADGRQVPTAFNDVSFSLEGPAQWRGGIAQGPDNYILATTLPVELGINRVSIRSTPTPGTITLKATSEGLKSATIELQTQAVPQQGGLSSIMPDVGLMPSLVRGPTPTEPTVTPTRQALEIVSATAGSRQELVEKSFDDDESTSWSSENKIRDAWIRYELKAPTTIDEVVARMGRWRTRSYPIQILVDDKEVYAGGTPRSLGYVHMKFAPVTGKSVTIRLIGRPSDRDEFDITEITGMKLKAGTEDGPGGSGTLQIVECELYGPLN